MKRVTTKEEIIRNLEAIEQYLQGKQEYRDEMARLIARGKCFVAYVIDGKFHFAPSRFVGYANNSLDKHDSNKAKHGTRTNDAISKVFKRRNSYDDELETSYLTYCKLLDVTPNENKTAQRSYWLLDGVLESQLKKTHFTEGKRKLIIHEVSERDPRVVKEAKRIFKKEHNGELFCEICGFNFRLVYGKVGTDFIEAHHKVSLSSTTKEHKVKPSDLMMVCPNCHAMLHREENGKYLSAKKLKARIEKMDGVPSRE